jgi:hypothetical protein
MRAISNGRRTSGRGLILAMVLLGAGVLASASTALAYTQVEYPPGQKLSEPGLSSFMPQLAIDSQNRITVVWMRDSGPIQMTRIDADGMPGPIQTLGMGVGGAAAGPEASVVVDSLDRATVVWRGHDGDESRVKAVRIGADGALGPVQTLSPAGGYAMPPRLAVDPHDRVTVVWSRFDDPIGYRVQAVRLAVDGTPGAVRTLSPGAAFESDVVVDSQGRATVAWWDSDLQAVRLAADGAPGPVYSVSGGQPAGDASLAVGPDDRVIAVWQALDGAHSTIRSTCLGTYGPGEVRTLSDSGSDAARPEVAVDGHGRATAAWVRSDGTNWRAQGVRLAGDGRPRTVRTLSEPGGDAWDPQVAIDSRGRSVVAWSRNKSYEESLGEVVSLGANGVPGPVQVLSEGEQYAFPTQVGIDSLDRPAVVWHAHSGSPLGVYLTRGVLAPALGDPFGEALDDPSVDQQDAECDDAPPPAGPPPGDSHAIVLGSRLIAKRDDARVAVRLTGADDGEIRTGRLRIAARIVPSGRAHARPQRTLIGAAHYRLRAGARKTLRLRLTAAGRRLLARRSLRTARSASRKPGRRVWRLAYTDRAPRRSNRHVVWATVRGLGPQRQTIVLKALSRR